MQYCILFVIAFGLVSTDLLPQHEVAFPFAKLVAILLCQLLVVFVAAIIALQTQASASGIRSKDSLHVSLSKAYHLHTAVWVGSSICMLVCFDWANMLSAQENGLPLLLARPLVLLPIISSLILSWAVLFDAERAIEPELGTSSRWPFVIDQARRFLFVPLAILLVAVSWSDAVTAWWPGDANATFAFAVRLIPLFAFVALLPLVMRLSWNTQPLAKTDLRNKLEFHSRESGCPPRDILVWDTRNRMANAAITGVLPTFQYLLLSDRLLRDLPPEQVELIALHEIAHAKHRHQLKLMIGLSLSIGGCIMLLWTLTNLLLSTGGEGRTAAALPLTVGCVAGCLLVVVMTVRILGRFARGLELEADLWAARKCASPMNYMLAVAKIASGNPRQATWLHPSVQERCEFLLKGLEPASVFLRSELRANSLVLAVWIFVLSFTTLVLTSQ